MIVLAVDTALAAVQAAVLDGERVLAALSEPMAKGHQERLAPLVAEALAQAGVAAAEVERVAVTTGPGSFTGLRVGLAFAKVFALARGIGCSGVGTLEALAASAPGPGEVVACIAAPRERAYAQRFAGGRPLTPPQLLSLEAASELAGGARPVGPGAALLGGEAQPAWPDVAAVGRLGAARHVRPDPIYLREVGALTTAERRAVAP